MPLARARVGSPTLRSRRRIAATCPPDEASPSAAASAVSATSGVSALGRAARAPSNGRTVVGHAMAATASASAGKGTAPALASPGGVPVPTGPCAASPCRARSPIAAAPCPGASLRRPSARTRTGPARPLATGTPVSTVFMEAPLVYAYACRGTGGATRAPTALGPRAPTCRRLVAGGGADRASLGASSSAGLRSKVLTQSNEH